MIKSGSSFLREITRLTVQDLGLLEKSKVSCCNVSLSQCHAVVEIGRAAEMSLNDLAQVLNLDKSTMSRVVNTLVENEYVDRLIDQADRRYIRISLTEKGKHLYQSIENNMNQYFEDIFQKIPEHKQKEVTENLELIMNILRNKQD